MSFYIEGFLYGRVQQCKYWCPSPANNKSGNVCITEYWGTSSVCVCSLSYPACRAHVRCYIVICGLSGCTIYCHSIAYIAVIYGKKLLKLKCVFWFSLQSLSETFHILRRIQRDITMNVCMSSCKVSVILVRFEWNLISLDSCLKNDKISNSFLWVPNCTM
jgi:hypothetical protein